MSITTNNNAHSSEGGNLCTCDIKIEHIVKEEQSHEPIASCAIKEEVKTEPISPLFKTKVFTHSDSINKKHVNIQNFLTEVISNVQNRLKGYIKAKYRGKNEIKTQLQKEKSRKRKLVYSPPIAKSKKYLMKSMADKYLDAFLDIIDDDDDESCNSKNKDISTDKDIELINPVILATNKGTRSSNPCSFGYVIYDEGYVSKPLDNPKFLPACPWPSIDRCLLSSQVECKNGSIYVVRHRTRDSTNADKKKVRRGMSKNSDQFYQPKYITPLEYHQRVGDHRRYLERRQWQHITVHQDYNNWFFERPFKSIPKYIFDNQFRPSSYSFTTKFTNHDLLYQLQIRLDKISMDKWDEINRIVAETDHQPLAELSAFEVDTFFWRQYVFSANQTYELLKKSRKKRKNQLIIEQLRPELYHPNPYSLVANQYQSLPQHSKRNHNAHNFNNFPNKFPYTKSRGETRVRKTVPKKEKNEASNKKKCPTIPNTPKNYTPPKNGNSPEFKKVENMYSFRRRIAE